MARSVASALRLAMVAICFVSLIAFPTLLSQVPPSPQELYVRAGKVVRCERAELVLLVGAPSGQQQIIFALVGNTRLDPVSPGDTVNVVYAKDANRYIAYVVVRPPSIESPKAPPNKIDNLGVAEMVLPPPLASEVANTVGVGPAKQNGLPQLSTNFTPSRAEGVIASISVVSPFETAIEVAAPGQTSKASTTRFRLTLITQVKGVLRTGVPVAVYYDESHSPYTATRVVVNPQ